MRVGYGVTYLATASADRARKKRVSFMVISIWAMTGLGWVGWCLDDYGGYG